MVAQACNPGPQDGRRITTSRLPALHEELQTTMGMGKGRKTGSKVGNRGRSGIENEYNGTCHIPIYFRSLDSGKLRDITDDKLPKLVSSGYNYNCCSTCNVEKLNIAQLPDRQTGIWQMCSFHTCLEKDYCRMVAVYNHNLVLKLMFTRLLSL